MRCFVVDENGFRKCNFKFSPEDEEDILNAITTSYNAIPLSSRKNFYPPRQNINKSSWITVTKNTNTNTDKETITFEDKCFKHIWLLENENN